MKRDAPPHPNMIHKYPRQFFINDSVVEKIANIYMKDRVVKGVNPEAVAMYYSLRQKLYNKVKNIETD